MRIWRAIGIALVASVMLASVPSVAVAATLTVSDGRLLAESAVQAFRARHDLDEAHVTRCKRLSSTRISCAAAAAGEGASSTTECTLRVEVRLPAGDLFAAAAIVAHRCAHTARPHLTYAEAHAAIQEAADSFAGTVTTITEMRRLILSFEDGGEGAYSGRAEWERPALQPTEYSPTESCSVEVEAAMKGGRVTTGTEGFACY